jgi:hypothetical protein
MELLLIAEAFVSLPKRLRCAPRAPKIALKLRMV